MLKQTKILSTSYNKGHRHRFVKGSNKTTESMGHTHKVRRLKGNIELFGNHTHRLLR